ncbi:MAG TPA: DUF2188 domain-containing protein [Flavisolibacter sp.]|nr:DUF2188 domain-containing protein [Flavisolibacter sp.]
MSKNLYVSPRTGDWKVHWEKETNGAVFSLKEDAIRHARSLVRERKEGEVLSIRVQRADGTFQSEWTYGKDPYPPKG